MKALVFEKTNQSPSLLKVEEPIDINTNDVIVEVLAAAINHRDLWITKGMYPGIKPDVILGSDACGVIDGKEVIINAGLNWGKDERYQSDAFTVLGMPGNGTFASKVVVPKENVFTKPDHLSIEEAAALPLAGVTAFRALFVKANPSKSDKVFISGIGGGVSLFAFQFAVNYGCEVYVSSSSQDKIDLAIKMGAKGGVNYKEKDFSKQLLKMSGGIDIVIDSAGGDGFSSLVYACNPGARMVFYGGTRGKINNLNPQIIFWRQIHIMGSTMGSNKDFEAMLKFVNDYKIKPIVDSVFPLSEAKAAFSRMENGEQFGKIVFLMK